MRWRWLAAGTVTLATLLTVAASPLLAQPPSRVLAFGDSITRGDSRFDTQNRGGYPGRLQSKLRQEDPDAVVVNGGRDSEVTAEGLSRIRSSMADANPQTVIIMEGTNDVNLVLDGEISFESVAGNLAAMAGRVTDFGSEPILATVIPRPPTARRDVNNDLTFALVREIRDTAFRQQGQLSDIFDAFLYSPNPFGTLYSRVADTVGHPNPDGFALMADTFFDLLNGDDRESPVAGQMLPGYLVPELRPGDRLELEIYDLGEGIDRATATLTINGEPIETTASGGPRKVTLEHRATADSLSCFANFGFSASDQADPPNVAHKVLQRFPVQGGRILRGDLDKSCRVDGIDLLIVAYAFGARDGEPRYSQLADITDDGVVNGRDFAELASNFGRSND